LTFFYEDVFGQLWWTRSLIQFAEFADQVSDSPDKRRGVRVFASLLFNDVPLESPQPIEELPLDLVEVEDAWMHGSSVT